MVSTNLMLPFEDKMEGIFEMLLGKKDLSAGCVLCFGMSLHLGLLRDRIYESAY